MVGMGVADGVYMWKMSGVDSGPFSRELMTSARAAVQTGVNDVRAGAVHTLLQVMNA